MRLGGATFLGASPERLVRRSGTRVDADALAGSARSGTRRGTRPDALRSSAKDLAEHVLVVRAIRQALAPRCRRLSSPVRPSLRSFPGLRHLHTPIRGELRDETHVLELVEALHPTPAVGGFPRDAALRFLRSHEAPRGWYAGAFGWFDAVGDGEFAVAIRSGLVRGRRADLWAGAGVVAGSTAPAEIDEIDGKLATMMRALAGDGA
jgi:isochorismate synthase